MNHYSIQAREIGSTGIFFPVLVRAMTCGEAIMQLRNTLQMETTGTVKVLTCGTLWVKCKETIA